MPKKPANDLTTATSSKFRDIGSIMKDPVAKATLMNYVDEAVNAKSEIANQQAQIKLIRERALEELGLNPKLFNSYVAAAFNNDYSKRKQTLDEQLTMLQYITGEIGLKPAPSEDDDE